ncbi:MAG: hypothetical protein GY811_28240 [Myxococcales bacterium]|nr:hypothetical protein [Myxococcales bacterium]
MMRGDWPHCRVLHSLHLGVLAAITLTMVSCRQPPKSSETPTSGGDSGRTGSATAKAMVGAYECTMKSDDGEYVAETCAVDEGPRVSMAGQEWELSATLLPETFGFTMQGTLRLGALEHTARAELFRQGGDSYAAIISLPRRSTPGLRILRLTMLPAANSPSTEH